MRKDVIVRIFLSVAIVSSLSSNISYAKPLEIRKYSDIYVNEKVVPYKMIIEWRYKVINKKLYKRQYNRTTNKWIGEWVLVE